MTLRFQYPRSFTSLLLVGFTLVALPLLGGMVNTGLLLDRMVREGRQAVETTVEVTRGTRRLAELALALERSAGQLYVLEDPALKEALAGVHGEFGAILSSLGGMPWGPPARVLLERIGTLEQTLYSDLGAGPGEGGFARFEPAFDELHGAVTEMMAAGNAAIDGRVEALSARAADVQRVLLWQGATIAPLSLFLVGLFSWLINRPVRQLARAIRRLGEHDLEPGPVVNGPRDLAFLGEQVDWLRLRLVELEAQKQRFLRHVSHELKTPLAALREGVELLSDRVGGELSAQQEEIAGIMRENAIVLQRRIEDLLRYNRAVQAGELRLPEWCPLAELVETAVHKHDLALRARRIRIETDLGELRVRGDRGKLETVFENLIGNAVRFSPAGGIIGVRARTEGAEVVITLRDQGPGVAAADRDHIFEPFHQGVIQPPGSVQGTGLGLAIVREYVQAHGGRVSLLEETTEGACFQVILPLQSGRRDEV